jgi:hypothetical protein
VTEAKGANPYFGLVVKADDILKQSMEKKRAKGTQSQTSLFP